MNEYVVNLIFEDLFGSYYTNIRFFIFIFIHLLFIYYLEICHILLDIFIIEANMNIDNDNNNNNNNRTAIVEFNQLKTSLYEQAVNRENKIENGDDEHSLVIIGRYYLLSKFYLYNFFGLFDISFFFFRTFQFSYLPPLR